MNKRVLPTSSHGVLTDPSSLYCYVYARDNPMTNVDPNGQMFVYAGGSPTVATTTTTTTGTITTTTVITTTSSLGKTTTTAATTITGVGTVTATTTTGSTPISTPTTTTTPSDAQILADQRAEDHSSMTLVGPPSPTTTTATSASSSSGQECVGTTVPSEPPASGQVCGTPWTLNELGAGLFSGAVFVGGCFVAGVGVFTSGRYPQIPILPAGEATAESGADGLLYVNQAGPSATVQGAWNVVISNWGEHFLWDEQFG